MEFETSHAIADIDQGRARVLLDDAGSIFDGLENYGAGKLAERKILLGGKVEVELLRVLFLVEGLRTAIQHGLHIRWHAQVFFLHSRDRLFNADRIPGFERSQLPAKSPTHGAIDFDNRV